MNTYIKNNFPINCLEAEDFEDSTFDSAKASSKKRFNKKLTQLEQYSFYKMAILQKEVFELKTKVESMENMKKELEKVKENVEENAGKGRKRKNKMWDDAPKVNKKIRSRIVETV